MGQWGTTSCIQRPDKVLTLMSPDFIHICCRVIVIRNSPLCTLPSLSRGGYYVNQHGGSYILIYSSSCGVFLEQYILFNNSIIVHQICPQIFMHNHYVITYICVQFHKDSFYSFDLI